MTAVVLHEFAHAKTAKKLNYALNEIRLMPYGAALCGSVDMRPKHEAIIAAAGPAVNLALGLIFAAMWWLFPSSYAFTSGFCVCNMYIGLFNLLPIYPLDGGRILLALLSRRVSRKKAYFAMRIVSLVFGIIAIALFVVTAFYSFNLCFFTVGMFMVVSALIPDSRAKYQALFAFAGRRERIKKPTEVRTFAVSQSAPLIDLYRALDPDRFCIFDVYTDMLEKRCTVDEGELIELVKTFGYSASVSAALEVSRSKINCAEKSKHVDF